MKVVLCGFPGSGKSTVFRALSPGASGGRGGVVFGNIKVPDDRIERLSAVFNPKKKVFAEITFTDIEGADSKPGSAFPPSIIQEMRNADVMVHVVKAFEDPTDPGAPDPDRAVRAFEEELLLLDLGLFEKRVERFKKENRSGLEVEVAQRCMAWLEDSKPLRTLTLTDDERKTLQGIQLLSLTPLLTVFNLSEDQWANSPLRTRGGDTIAMCGLLEAEIAEMSPEEQREYLEGMGLGEPARNDFIRKTYHLLDLISFLTAGHDECRAWPVRRGSTARRAAGRIHSDLERGFIRAEVYRLEDLLAHGSEAALKSTGKLRVEGKDYIVQDGDVMNIRHNT